MNGLARFCWLVAGVDVVTMVTLFCASLTEPIR